MKKSIILGSLSIVAVLGLTDHASRKWYDDRSVPMLNVVETINNPATNLGNIAEEVNEDKSQKLEELIRLTLKRHLDEEFVEKHGPIFQHITENPRNIKISEINDFVIPFSPEWCIACKEIVPRYQRLFEERYMKRENHPAMTVFKSLSELGNPDDPFENFYQSLGVKRFPTYAIAQRDKETTKMRIIYVNLSDDIGTGRLERDINKYIYGEDHGSAFVDPILQAIYDNCEPVIDALTREKVPEISVSEEGKPTIQWNLADPSHFDLALPYDLSSKGVYEHYLERLKKEIWLKTNAEPIPHLPDVLVEHLFRTYFPEEKAERLIGNISTWRKYFAVGGDGPLYPDPTLVDILVWDEKGIFLGPDPTNSYLIPVVSGKDHERMLEDRRAHQKALSEMNNHNIPLKIRRHWDSLLAYSESNYDGTAEKYRFPNDAVSNDFKSKMEEFRQRRGVVVEYFDLPSYFALAEHTKSLGLRGDKAENYFRCLLDARDGRKDMYKEWRKYFIPGNTPYEVLASMIADKPHSIVSRAYFTDEWGREFVAMLQRNRADIDANLLGVFALENLGGKLGPFPPYKRGIAHYLLAYGLPPEMNTGAIVVTSDLHHVGNLMDWGNLKAIDDFAQIVHKK